MRAFLTLCIRCLRVGWFWVFLLLALPNCGLPSGTGECYGSDCPGWDGDGDCDPGDPECPDSNPDPESVWDPGGAPGDAIYCDFPKPPGGTECATAQEALDGLSMASAAVALVQGQSYAIALDWSADAVAACGGLPRKTEYLEGSFPWGSTVCLNCGLRIPATYATPTKACVAKCTDLINFGGGTIPAEGAAAYCDAHAKTSINTDPDKCYSGYCSVGGTGTIEWRHIQEEVSWTDLSGTDLVNPGVDGSIKRTAATTGTGDSDFNAGAASTQLITTGDGWVEFAAGQNDLSHVIGLRTSCADIVVSCPDTDYGLGGIGFALSLNSDNKVYVLEAGSPLVVVETGFTYTPSDRFRVRVTDQNNGTAVVSYTKVASGCLDGNVCAETPLYTSATAASYPLRIDVTFREVGASLDKVTVVRIKQ
jgi:hypothetical protein